MGNKPCDSIALLAPIDNRQTAMLWFVASVNIEHSMAMIANAALASDGGHGSGVSPPVPSVPRHIS